VFRDYFKRSYRKILPLLYSKKNYKFFLNSTFGSIDKRIKKLSVATNLFSKSISPILIKPPFGARMLIVAPHHDDEIIGPGGAALAHVKCGGLLQIVVVNDGTGHEKLLGLNPEQLTILRESESKKVASKIGASSPIFLKYNSTAGPNIAKIANDLKEIINDYKPNSIFVPFILDNDSDHYNCALSLSTAIDNTKHSSIIYGYEVWGLCIANVAVAIDEVIDYKCELINMYSSQIQHIDYAHSVRGLAMYHSLLFGWKQTRFVENFFELPSWEYVQFLKKFNGEL
jgi:N-acetylglucosamine malate deacetylase 1